MFVLIFGNFKPGMLSCKPLRDHVMPCTEVLARAQVTHGNITVLSHLKL